MGVDAELRGYLLTLWRHRWTIIACACLASLVALAISLLLKPKYSATATLRMASSPAGVTDYISLPSITRLSNTLVEIATSDSTLDEVAKRLALAKRPAVKVQVVPETELIRITASDPSPATARDIANTLATLMVDQSSQLYSAGGPTARQILEGQLAQAKSDLDAAVAAYQAALEKSVRALDPNTPALNLPESAELATLGRLISIRQQLYGDILQRYEAARLNEQLRANSVSISEAAALPPRPSSPRLPLNAALGLLAGLVAGVMLAFLFEGMDDTVRDLDEMQAMSPLPILCQVSNTGRPLASFVGPARRPDVRLLLKPSLDRLATRLLLSPPMTQRTSFLITSPEPGAGKSTIAAHLAISLAEAGQRVVLLDLDFRRPHLHTILNSPVGHGLSDYLCQKIPLEAALRETPYPNLKLATAGSSLEGISELLAAVTVKGLLERLKTDGFVVIIDAPAFLAAADPAVIASQASAVILVVAQRGSRRKQVRLSLQQLSELNADIAGIVLNRVPGSALYRSYSEDAHTRTSRLRRERATVRGPLPSGARAPATSREDRSDFIT